MVVAGYACYLVANIGCIVVMSVLWAGSSSRIAAEQQLWPSASLGLLRHELPCDATLPILSLFVDRLLLTQDGMHASSMLAHSDIDCDGLEGGSMLKPLHGWWATASPGLREKLPKTTTGQS